MHLLWPLVVTFLIEIYSTGSHANPLPVFNKSDDIYNDGSIQKYLVYGPKEESEPRMMKEMHWFRIQIKTLKDHNLVTEFPENLFPVSEEYVWFNGAFLMDFSWINESRIADQEVYILKGERNFMLQPYETRKIQDFYVDSNYDFRRFLTQTTTNAQCSKQIKALQLLSGLKIESHERKEVFLAFQDIYSSYSVGSFGELDQMSYNELPKEISDVKLAIKRQLLDYHYALPSERELLGYDSPNNFDSIEEQHYPAILSVNLTHYLYRVGRYNRFVESIYLLHLSILNRTTNEYHMPYRLVDPHHSDQNEHTYYAIPKDKIRETFNISQGDDGYLSLFNQVEGETSYANEAWISNQLLNYLKALNMSINEAELKKVSHKEMVVKMCQIEKGLSTRLFSLHMVIDYSPFIDDVLMYQHTFNSKLLLRWTCFTLNKEFCADRTISIACSYLFKNYPTKEYQTKRLPFRPTGFDHLSGGVISVDYSTEKSNSSDTTFNSTFLESSNSSDSSIFENFQTPLGLNSTSKSDESSN